MGVYDAANVQSEMRPMEPPMWVWYLDSPQDVGENTLPADLRREALSPKESQDESVTGIGDMRQFVQRHWTQFVDLLHGENRKEGTATGYRRLARLREELQLRLETLTERIAITEDRIDYVALVFERLVTDLVEEVEAKPRWNLALRAAEFEPKDIRAWSLTEKTVEDVFEEVIEERILADLFAGESRLYPPQIIISDEEIRDEGIEPKNLRSTRVALGQGVKYEKTSREDLIPSRLPLDPEYGEDATWGGTLTELIDTHEVLKEQRTAAWRARDMADFRLSVLDNVLYRFELFGRVEEDIRKFVNESKLEVAGAVVRASRDSDIGWGRREITRKAATICDDETAETYRTVERTLGSLYPKQSRRGNPGSDKENLGRLMVERCKRYVDAFTY